MGSRRSHPFFCSTESWWATEEPTAEPTETAEPTGAVVEPSDPTPSISPTVKGVKIVKRPVPQLPRTGAPTGLLLAAGLALVVGGGALVLQANRYERQH